RRGDTAKGRRGDSDTVKQHVYAGLLRRVVASPCRSFAVIRVRDISVERWGSHINRLITTNRNARGQLAELRLHETAENIADLEDSHRPDSRNRAWLFQQRVGRGGAPAVAAVFESDQVHHCA